MLRAPAVPPIPESGRVENREPRGGGRGLTVPAWRRPPINYVSAERETKIKVVSHGAKLLEVAQILSGGRELGAARVISGK